MKSLKETLIYIALCWVILYLIFSVGSATLFFREMDGLVRLFLALLMFCVALISIANHLEEKSK